MNAYGLIGQSIYNSLSPKIHSKIFELYSLDACYTLHSIEDFESEISLLLSGQEKGYNITIPFKQKIIPYLARLDSSAIYAGAVNTIKREAEGWVGYNTDGEGFITSVRHYMTPGNAVLLMGTGGAAFGIASALVQNGFVDLTCAGRSKVGHDALKAHLETYFQVTPKQIPYSDINPGFYDVIINATSVGMEGADQEHLFDYTQIKASHVVVDIVYKPEVTPLIGAARLLGAVTVGGHPMLCAQALASEQIWQGHFIENDRWDHVLKEVLIEVMK